MPLVTATSIDADYTEPVIDLEEDRATPVPHRCYGYLFGGSGGAYQTMGAAQYTSGVWEGFLPFVPGCDNAIPSTFTVRMHAQRVLRRRNRFPAIADALAPGGSGDPYADLNKEEAAALREVTSMGFPPRAWYRHAGMDSGYFANISGMIPALDPDYVEDFWSKPGYSGAEAGAAITADRFAFESTIAAIDASPPWSLTLVRAPDHDCANAHMIMLSGAAAGASLPLAAANGAVMQPIATADAAAIAALAPGDRVRIDNAWALALETYHRHQVPEERECRGWDQFRDAQGQPIPPQRPILVGPIATIHSAGGPITGEVHGKVLALAALMDIDALPWQADWYRGRVEAAMGEDFADTFALWFVDRAHHENPLDAQQRAHVVSFSGALQQGHRDLARWVEQDIHPADTRYTIEDCQVLFPEDAEQRGSVQPVVELLAEGEKRVSVAIGQSVALSAAIEAPPGAGKVVSAEWDFDGAGEFPVAAQFRPAERVELHASHAWDTPGTRLVGLKVAVQREGDPETPYAKVLNLDLVRVVVE